MFPLGTVLFPSMLLPLKVFEPRYRQMMRDCLDRDNRFGVCMIERGSEVGGGDVRSMVGCSAAIVQAEERPNGQWMLVAMGTARLRVLEWLEDDPYPRALVELWNEAEDELPAAEISALDPVFRTVLALAAELDEWSVPLSLELGGDPLVALYRMCSASPIGAFDRQRLLACPGARARSLLLHQLLTESAEHLRARLAAG